MGAVRIGIGGWNYAPWRGVFYPKGLPQRLELEFASRQLTSIEINSTFYGSQKPESFARWHDETPDDFVFSLKAPRFATNRKVLAGAGPSVERFFDSGVTELKAKLGPVNWQFAATKTFDPEDFAAFLKLLPAEAGGLRLRHAVELRHESFAVPEAAEIARERGVAIVRARDGPYPEIDAATVPFAYARIMGTDETVEEGYPGAALDRWAARARQWSEERDVYLYVIGGGKVRNPAAARALIERLG